MTDTNHWPIERIPDAGRLFYRVPAAALLGGDKLGPNVFRSTEGTMSCDWEKYSTPEETRLRARNPDNHGIVTLVAGQVREIEHLQVVHEPLSNNRAHSSVQGFWGTDVDEHDRRTRTLAVRQQLFDRFCTWEIEPPTLPAN